MHLSYQFCHFSAYFFLQGLGDCGGNLVVAMAYVCSLYKSQSRDFFLMCTRISVRFPVVFATILWSKVFYLLPYLN